MILVGKQQELLSGSFGDKTAMPIRGRTRDLPIRPPNRSVLRKSHWRCPAA
jgi:hypothetical protein